MQRRVASQFVLWVVCLPMAAVFGTSGVAKLLHPPDAETFASGALTWLAPVATSLLSAVAVLEVACGILMLLPPARRPARWLATGLCLAFLVAISTQAGNSEFVSDCKCFGVLSQYADNTEGSVIGLLARAAVLGWASWLACQWRPALGGDRRSVALPTLVWGGLLLSSMVVSLLVRATARDIALEHERGMEARSTSLLLRFPFAGCSSIEPGPAWGSGANVRPVTVVVFGTTCGHCRHHAYSWRALRRLWNGAGEDLLFLSADADQAVRNFCEEFDVPGESVATCARSLLEGSAVVAVPEVMRFGATGLLEWRSSLPAPEGPSGWLQGLRRDMPELFERIMLDCLAQWAPDVDASAIVADVTTLAAVDAVHFRAFKHGVLLGCGFVAQAMDSRTGTRLDFVHIVSSAGDTLALVPLHRPFLYGRTFPVALPSVLFELPEDGLAAFVAERREWALFMGLASGVQQVVRQQRRSMQ